MGKRNIVIPISIEKMEVQHSYEQENEDRPKASSPPIKLKKS